MKGDTSMKILVSWLKFDEIMSFQPFLLALPCPRENLRVSVLFAKKWRGESEREPRDFSSLLHRGLREGGGLLQFFFFCFFWLPGSSERARVNWESQREGRWGGASRAANESSRSRAARVELEPARVELELELELRILSSLAREPARELGYIYIYIFFIIFI